MLEVNEEKLRVAIARAGLDGFEAVQKRAKELGYQITSRTLYNLTHGQGWRQQTIVDLCRTLNCQPSDILDIDTNGAQAEPKKALAPVV